MAQTKPMRIVVSTLFLLSFFAFSNNGIAKTLSMRIKKIDAEKSLKDFKKEFEENVFSSLNLHNGIELNQDHFDASLVVNLKAMSYSMELGQAELMAEVDLLTNQGESFFKGTFWGSSGGKLGYKGSLQSLMKESSAQLGEKLAQSVVHVLLNPGLVTVEDRQNEIWFMPKSLKFHGGEKISVLRKGELVARAEVTKMNAETAIAKVLDKYETVRNGDEVFLAEWYEIESPIATDVQNFKKKKKSKIGYVLGLLGIGAVAMALAKGNNESKDPVITSTTPVNVRVGALNSTFALAPNGGGIPGNTTATLIATALNLGNQSVTSQFTWQTSAGFVAIASRDNSLQAVFTPPGTPQIVTISAIAGSYACPNITATCTDQQFITGNAQGQIRIHVGSQPARLVEPNGATSAPLPVSGSVIVSFRLFSDSFDQATGERILAPGNSQVTARLLRQDNLQLVAGSSIKGIDINGGETAAFGATLNLSSHNDGKIAAKITRGDVEAGIPLILEIRTLGGTPILLPNGNNFVLTN